MLQCDSLVDSARLLTVMPIISSKKRFAPFFMLKKSVVALTACMWKCLKARRLFGENNIFCNFGFCVRDAVESEIFVQILPQSKFELKIEKF